MDITNVFTNNKMSRNGYKPQWIICHGTAGFTNADDVAHYFQTSDVSSNYVIGRDGKIICCVPDDYAAWGNGYLSDGHDPWWKPGVNPNWQTISIEHVKPHTDNSDTLTPQQQAASFWLINYLCEKHGIPKRKADASGGITGHYSIDPVNRSRCPGPYPWDALFASFGSTMSTLPNFPMVNQLALWDTIDGRPAENAEYDCVPASISAGIQYLTGKHISPDYMKDEVYGENWVNSGTSADRFVGLADRFGVHMYPVTGTDPADTLNLAHRYVRSGHPVVFTQQDDYAPGTDFTHVCVFYGEGDGYLTCMDPFGGFELTYSNPEWRNRFRSNTLWIMEKKMGVPSGWKDDTKNKVLTAPNGKRVIQGFRDYILNNSWDAKDQPQEEVQAVDPVEEGFSQTPSGGTEQTFNYTKLAWTSKRGVYVVGIGHELLSVKHDRDTWKASAAEVPALKDSNNKLSASVTELTNQNNQLNQQVLGLQADATSKDAKIADLQKQLDDLKNQPTSPEAQALVDAYKNLIAAMKAFDPSV